MQTTHRQCILIITLFTIITLAYSLIIPVFNAPDEPFHFEYIQFIAKHKNFPNQTVEEKSVSTEGFNPPLYYLTNAVFLNFLSYNKASDIKLHTYQDIVNFYRNPYRGFRDDIYPPLNPNYVKWGQGKERNMFLTTKEDRFPFAGSIRIIHVLRIISVLFGALTILFIFKTAQILFPNNKNLTLLATSLCAFNPQFNFLSGSLNNDNLVILYATISIWLLTKLILTENNHKKRIIALLGICLGLGLITKVNLSSIVLITLIGIIYLSVSEKNRKLRNLSTHLIVFLGLLLIIAGWYFVRNIYIYGIKDPLGWGLQAIQNPGLVMPAKIRAMFFKKIFFQRLFTSFWGVFDWLTISLPNWTYWIYGIISLTGIVGIIISLLGKIHPKKRLKICFLLYLSAILISFANLIVLNFTFVSAQARLIFPTMACICIFIAIGIDTTFKYLTKLLKMKANIFVYGFILFLIGLDFYALFWILYPIYR